MPAETGPTVSAAPRLRHVPNAVSAMVLFAARLVAAVLQLRIVDRIWGGGYTGLNALSNQVLLYVTLLELGLAQSAITLLYEPIVHGKTSRVAGIIAALRHDVRRLAAAGAVVAFPAIVLYARVIHGSVPFKTVAFTLSCIAASGLVQLAAIHFQVFLNASEQLDKVNYTFAAGYLLKTGVGLALAATERNYLLLPLTTAVLTLGEFGALKFAFHHVFRDAPRNVDWRESSREIRSKARYVMIQRAAGVAYYQSDFVILSLTTSLVVVKDYAKYQYVAAALLSIIGMVAASLTTSVARLQLRHHAGNRRRQYVAAQSAICVVGGVLMLGFWNSAPAVVNLVFGTAQPIAATAIRLFAVALFLNVVKAVDDVFIMAKGAFEIGWWIPMLEVPVFVGTGIALSKWIGFAGILIASIATNLLVTTILKGIVLSRPIFDSSPAQWYGNRILSMCRGLAAVAPLTLLYGLTARFMHQNMMRLVFTSLLALVYMLAAIQWILWRKSANGQMAA